MRERQCSMLDGLRIAALAACAMPVGLAGAADLRSDVSPGAAATPPSAGAATPPVDAGRSVTASLLPDYSITGGVETRTETVNRTLFNPTRRPAPTPVQEAPKPQMQRGQFVLAGTTVVDGKATAFLREVKTGKFRRVAQGDNVNGMTVAEVKADRVKLAVGDESEEVSLKVIPNPRSTPAAAPPTAVAGAPLPPGVPAAAIATAEQEAQKLLERRRAARQAAENAPAGGPPVPAAPVPAAPVPQPGTPGAAAAQQGTTSWADVFRRYQERNGAAPGR